jgi:hypothetical protein
VYKLYSSWRVDCPRALRVWALLDYPKSMGQWSGHIGLRRHNTVGTDGQIGHSVVVISRTHRSQWYKVTMHTEQKVDAVDEVNTAYSGHAQYVDIVEHNKHS